jgi:hypothetical protein
MDPPVKPPGDPAGIESLIGELLSCLEALVTNAGRIRAARDLGIQGPAGDADAAALQRASSAADRIAADLRELVGLARNAATAVNDALDEYERKLAEWQQQPST